MTLSYMLDTDTVSYALRNHGRVVEHIRQHRPSELCISAISLAELRYGAEARQSAHIHRMISTFLEGIPVRLFDQAAADRFASVGAALTRRGTPIATFDTLIAAHAISLGVTLVTHNARHFDRVPDLKTETWV